MHIEIFSGRCKRHLPNRDQDILCDEYDILGDGPSIVPQLVASFKNCNVRTGTLSKLSHEKFSVQS